jgi:MraZ protein
VGQSGKLSLERGKDMFIGEFQHTIDTKGRLMVPSKFREDLGLRFVLTKGLDNCLFVYPISEWKNLEDKLKGLPLTSRDARAFVRFFFSGATECELDKQGRILVPASLREYAGIEKDVVVIGVSTRVEIWSKEEWDRYNSDTIMGYDTIAEKMAELGI